MWTFSKKERDFDCQLVLILSNYLHISIHSISSFLPQNFPIRHQLYGPNSPSIILAMFWGRIAPRNQQNRKLNWVSYSINIR